MIESNYLKDDVRNIEKLMEIPTLSRLDILELGTLLKISKIRQYDDGECIITEGERDSWMYVLLSGRVCIQKKGTRLGIIEEVGELFGEMRIIDNQSRSASVYAEGKAVCLSVDTSATHRVYSKNDISKIIALLYKVISLGLCKRLRLANEELIKARGKNVILKKKLQPISSP